MRARRLRPNKRMQKKPKYEELCRRFLADAVDFSEEKIAQAGISRRFSNDGPREECMETVAAYIRKMLA